MCVSQRSSSSGISHPCIVLTLPSPLPAYSGTVDIAEFFRFMDIERTKFSEKVTTARATPADWRPLT